MVAPPGTKTVQAALSEVKRLFGDESGVQITDDDLIGWLNDALLEIVSKNFVLEKESGFITESGIYSYALPRDIINIIAVTFGGKPLGLKSMANALELTKDDPLLEGEPQFYWTFADQLYFWPWSNGGDNTNLIIYYTYYPPTLTAPSDIIPTPDIYYSRIVEYMLSKAQELDEDVDGAARTRQRFEDKLHEATLLGEQNPKGSFTVITDADSYDYYW